MLFVYSSSKEKTNPRPELDQKGSCMSSKPQAARMDYGGSSASSAARGGSSTFEGTSYAAERALPGLPTANAKKLANGLGWFSIGLGLTELLAPNTIAKITGVSNRRTGLIRLYGLREIAAGIGIFAQQKPTEAVWSRVAGDAMDLASLGVAFTGPNAKKGRIAFATANVLAVTALDLICAKQLSTGAKGIHAKASCIVNRSPQEVYSFWRNFSNLSRFMKHLESVTDMGDGRSHWVAKGPANTNVEWDATIIADVPGEVITWRSLENSDVDHAGAVRFEQAPGGRGTIVKVNIEYNPPAGVIGATVAKLFGEEPEQQLDDDLRRFKQVLEVGEVVVSDATLLGTGYFAQRPARPAAASELEEAESLPSELGTNYPSDEGRLMK
jgi:uncharacterized membrane protein